MLKSLAVSTLSFSLWAASMGATFAQSDSNCTTISEILCDNNGIYATETLCEIIQEAGLGDDLDNDKWTVFAPINEAFNSVSFETLLFTVGNNTAISNDDTRAYVDLLSFHVAPKSLDSSELMCDGEILMVNDEPTVTICEGDRVYQKGSGNLVTDYPEILVADIEACNGFVHLISDLMIDENGESSASQSTDSPSQGPSVTPTDGPSLEPSMMPSNGPSLMPSDGPSMEPSLMPSDGPSMEPSMMPSDGPSLMPSDGPSLQPSLMPSDGPSLMPSDGPSMEPSLMPSDGPSMEPSMMPSDGPSLMPSDGPSMEPSMMPSDGPSLMPSDGPSMEPSLMPSDGPSLMPSDAPTAEPSLMPSDGPSMEPSMMPSHGPSLMASNEPTAEPSLMPSDGPSLMASNDPTVEQSLMPSDGPSLEPSKMPSRSPVKIVATSGTGLGTASPTDAVKTIAPTTLAPTDAETLASTRDPCTIADVVCASAEHTRFCSAINTAGLKTSLGDYDVTCTVFAPNDDAFEKLGAGPLDYLMDPDQAILGQILAFHTVEDKAIYSSDLKCKETIEMANGKDTRTVCRKGSIFQKGKGNSDMHRPEITEVDIQTCNGVIHVVNEVMLFDYLDELGIPPRGSVVAGPGEIAPVETKSPTMSPSKSVPKPVAEEKGSCKTIDQVMCDDPDFSILCQLLETANIKDLVAGESWTLFAPNNAAFLRLPPDYVEALTDDMVVLDHLLKFHLVENEVLFKDDLPCIAGQNLIGMANGKNSRTLCKRNEDRIPVPTIQRGTFNEPEETAPHFVKFDIEACNGVIHELDGVLLFQLVEPNHL